MVTCISSSSDINDINASCRFDYWMFDLKANDIVSHFVLWSLNSSHFASNIFLSRLSQMIKLISIRAASLHDPNKHQLYYPKSAYLEYHNQRLSFYRFLHAQDIHIMAKIIFQTPSLINDIAGCICSYGTKTSYLYE